VAGQIWLAALMWLYMVFFTIAEQTGFFTYQPSFFHTEPGFSGHMLIVTAD